MAFLLFAVVAAITPGPSNVMLTAAGANAGVLGGLPCLFGAATGMGLMLFLVPLGLGSVVLRHPLALKVLNWGGAAFLLWLSWKIATASRVESRSEGKPLGYSGRGDVPVGQPEIVARERERCGNVSERGGGQPHRAGRLPRRALLHGGATERLRMAGPGSQDQHVLHSPRRLRVFNIAMGAVLALSILLIVV